LKNPKIKYLVLSLIIFIVFPVYTQVRESSRSSSGSDIFIAPLTEAIFYGRSGIALGGGLAFGMGSGGVTIGLRFIYTVDPDKINMLEPAIFLRLYPLNSMPTHGLFVQLVAGTSIFKRGSFVSIPAEVGTISAGFAAGWRFMLGNNFFIEPALRAGYPYMIGGGLSAGYRF